MSREGIRKFKGSPLLFLFKKKRYEKGDSSLTLKMKGMMIPLSKTFSKQSHRYLILA
jgi:hypothetical protein